MIRSSAALICAFLFGVAVHQTTAFAEDPVKPSDLPKGLSCVPKDHAAFGPLHFTIDIAERQTGAPVWNGDGDLASFGITPGSVMIVFGNSDDSVYELTFPTSRLVAFAKGEVSYVKGTIHYTNHYGDSRINDGRAEGVSDLTCSKL